MTKTYLILLPESIDRNEFTAYLQTRAGNEFWFYNLPSSVFVNSNLSARQLSEMIDAKYGRVNHLVVCLDRGHDWQGRIPPDHAQYFKVGSTKS